VFPTGLRMVRGDCDRSRRGRRAGERPAPRGLPRSAKTAGWSIVAPDAARRLSIIGEPPRSPSPVLDRRHPAIETFLSSLKLETCGRRRGRPRLPAPEAPSLARPDPPSLGRSRTIALSPRHGYLRADLPERKEEDGVAAEITELLVAWSGGDRAALEQLLPLVYGEIKRVAARRLSREPPSNTLQPPALVHRGLPQAPSTSTAARWRAARSSSASRPSFMGGSLVDTPGGGRPASAARAGRCVALPAGSLASQGRTPTCSALDVRPRPPAELDPRQSGSWSCATSGLVVEETAALLELSRPGESAAWTMARAWLFRELGARRDVPALGGACSGSSTRRRADGRAAPRLRGAGLRRRPRAQGTSSVAAATAAAALETPVGDGTPTEGTDLVGRRSAPTPLRPRSACGMGTVYRARRDDGVYFKEVALKLLSGGARSTLFVERFRRDAASWPDSSIPRSPA